MLIADLPVPLFSADRPILGRVVRAQGWRIGSLPMSLTLTDTEIHLGFTDRLGPAFFVQLDAVAHQMRLEFLRQMGLK